MRIRISIAVLVALVVVGAAPAAGPPATVTPGQLTVGVSLPSEGFEVGVAKGSEVLYAQGFDVDLARALAKRLGLKRVSFVQSPFGRLFSFGPKPWDTLMLNLQTGRCQAVVYDAPSLGTLKARAPDRYGPFVGVIKTGEQYGVALPKGSPLLQRANAAIAALIADGTVKRLQKKWLTADLSRLPVLG
jgi:ABC-type amino acid transport substrate-binding protein